MNKEGDIIWSTFTQTYSISIKGLDNPPPEVIISKNRKVNIPVI